MMFKTSLIKSSFVLGALLVSSATAWAVAGDVTLTKTLNTSPLYADGGKTYHACAITNVTTSSVAVKVDLLDNVGNTIITSGTTPLTIVAGATSEISLQSSETYTGFAHCRFLIYNGNDDAVRANEAVFVQTGGYFATIAFSEAR